MIQQKDLIEFDLLLTIPGICTNLAARIIAELSDIERFPNHKCFNAFLGLDPTLYQSGQMSGEHLRITKKGNKELRVYYIQLVEILYKTTDILKYIFQNNTCFQLSNFVISFKQ